MKAIKTETKTGHFSKVYTWKGLDVVRVESSCKAKECLSLSVKPGLHIPKITSKRCNLFSMPYYHNPEVISDHISYADYILMSELKRIGMLSLRLCPSHYNHYHEHFSNSKVLTNSQKDMLIGWLDALAVYGHDMVLDTSAGNFAVDNDRLILLDIWFFKSQV